MKEKMNIDLSVITSTVFAWVMYGIGLNLALYALGLVGINFATFFGSILLIFVLTQLTSSVVYNVLVQMFELKLSEQEEPKDE